MEDQIKIVVADSHEIVCEGIVSRLTAEGVADVVGQAADGYSTIKLCRQLKPDALVLDLELTRPAGTETFEKLRSQMPELKILILSSAASATDAFTVLSKGAAGFLPRQAKGDHIANAVRTIAMGYSCLPMQFLEEFAVLRRHVTRTGNIYGLSPREIEVLDACAAGRRTKEVAEGLSISVRTVETHRNSIYRKTACRSIGELSTIMRTLWGGAHAPSSGRPCTSAP